VKRFVYLCLLLAFSVQAVNAESRATVMTNDALALQPSSNYPSDGMAYWQYRNQAFEHARKDEWEQAVPLLESITSQYTDDGDTWSLLGHGYLQLGRCDKSIPALERALALGTMVTGVPSVSSPSNDIMIKVARCQAALGAEDAALAWIEKALAYRWDDRRRLIGSEYFASLADEDAYQRLSGELQQAGLSREQRWNADLQFLLQEIERLHVNPYHSISKQKLLAKAQAIETELAELTDQQVVFRMMELLGALGNGHNFIVPTNAKQGVFSKLPLQFYWFNDGVYIVNADAPYQALVGRKVIAVGDQAIFDVLEKIGRVNARDNNMQQRWLAPFYLALPEVLVALDIVESADEVPLTLAGGAGGGQTITLEGTAFSFSGFPSLPTLESNNPGYLANKGQSYWLEQQAEKDLLYVQFNSVSQMPSESLTVFSRRIIDLVNEGEVRYLVLDLRHNSGGDGSILPPITQAMLHFTANDPGNRLFVIVGRNTFSAAHLLLADLNRLTDAIIVGEPSGSRPNHMGEAGWFVLPYSDVWGIISSQYHQASRSEDHRVWVAPHLPVTLSSAQYFAGRDPAMEQILQLVASQTTP
jgi:tetratricopeptide (TPR) repeat protein